MLCGLGLALVLWGILGAFLVLWWHWH